MNTREYYSGERDTRNVKAHAEKRKKTIGMIKKSYNHKAVQKIIQSKAAQEQKIMKRYEEKEKQEEEEKEKNEDEKWKDEVAERKEAKKAAKENRIISEFEPYEYEFEFEEYQPEDFSVMGKSVGICTKNGIVLVCEERLESFDISWDKTIPRITQLEDNLAVLIEGPYSEVENLIANSKEECHRFLIDNKKHITALELANYYHKIIVESTETGNLNMGKISAITMGEYFHPMMVHVNKSMKTPRLMNDFSWKDDVLGGACVTIGENSKEIKKALIARYKEDATLEQTAHTILVLLQGFTESTLLYKFIRES